MRRPVATSVALAVFVSSLTVLALQPDPVAAAPARQQADVTDRPDAVSASLAARTQGHRVEDMSQRTEYAQTFANPDGTWTTETSTQPQFTQDTDGQWHDVDTTLVLRQGRLEARAALAEVSLSNGGDTTFAELHQDGKELDWHWSSPLPQPTIDGSTATYANVVPGGGDLVVTATATGFTHDIVLSTPPAAAVSDPGGEVSYTVPIATHGASLDTTRAGGVDVSQGKDTVASAPAPIMYDAAGDPGAGASVAPVDVEIGHNAAGTPTMTLNAEAAYLTDPKTVYPVTIDPTFSVDATTDTFASSANPTVNYSSAAYLLTGANAINDNDRAFLHFNFGGSDSPPVTGRDIVSATLQLQNTNSHSCRGSQINVNRVTEAWNASSLNWNNQPGFASAGTASFTPAYGYSSNCASNAATWDVTSIVHYWADNQGSNYGLRIKAANEGDYDSWRTYRSLQNTVGNGVNPKMSVTTNRFPNKPTGLTVSAGNTGYPRTTTPTLSAVVSDPDLGNVRGYFEVKNSAGTVVWSGTSTAVGNGGRASITMPSGKLSNGSTYTMRAWSEDASDAKSTTAAMTTVRVDTTAPSVTITSNKFTDQSWTTTQPSSSTFTYTGSGDTSYFLASRDGANQTVVWADSAGKWTGAWTPTSGWHVFTVTPVDKAGNQGAPVSYSFGTGNGSAQVDTPNAESTGSFPLTLTGPPGASSANLQWRLQGQGSWNDTTQPTAGGSAWAGAVTTDSSHSATPALVWKATAETDDDSTLSAPAVIEVRGCFHYTGSIDVCTPGRTVNLVPSAFGGNFPVADLGPASVALFTGEASISETDAADSSAGIGRSFSSFDDATLDPGPFGPGWSDAATLTPSQDSSAEVIDNRAKDGTFVIVAPDSGSQTFVPVAGSTTTWTPLDPTGDATSLTLTPGSGGAADSLALDRPLGTGTVTTSWTYSTSDTGGDPGWVISTVDQPGAANDVVVTPDHQRPTWIQESDPTAATTCTATTQTTGCRGIAIVYTGTGNATRVASITRVIGAATQAGVTTKTIATYHYDSSGLLTSVCTASPGGSAPALCTAYTYTTVGSRTMLATAAPAGLTAWRFGYDTTGRLTSVKRARPDNSGDSTWSVDYSLAPTSTGLPTMTTSAVAQWGQTAAPTKVFAVYAPSTGAASVTKADLYYTDNAGNTTNTATYGPSGWQVDTTWYDDDGNIVQHLDGPGWTRAQEAPAASRSQVASDASEYTVYNTWGDEDVVGTRVTDEYGPAHTATLADGTTGVFRTHTATIYDDTPGVDPALIAHRPGTDGLGLVVEEIDSASDAGRGSDYDKTVTKNGYDPIVTGDGNGWTLGVPTTVSQQIDAGTWSTQTTRYDTDGNLIETRQPGGSADSTGAGSDAHSTVTAYYTAGGAGQCGGKPAWAGLLCTTGPAEQPAGTPMPTTFYAGYSDDLMPTSIQELSDGVITRTTTTSYDALDRIQTVTKQTSGSGVSHETISTEYGYDVDSGEQTTVTVDGQSITTGYDAWGRVISYEDAQGTNATTTYDAAGEVAQFDDGLGIYDYTYDNLGNVSDVDAGGTVGHFGYTYTANGQLDTLTYPNGVVATRQYDEIGDIVGMKYAQGAVSMVNFSATVDVWGSIQAQSSSGSSQNFTFDGLGRLTGVQDLQATGCVTRAYAFTESGNRGSLTSFGSADDGSCQEDVQATSYSNDYDAAERLTNTGYSYDTLGRTLTLPQQDAGPDGAGAMAITYHADDMVAEMSQYLLTDGAPQLVSTTYGLDPAERITSAKTTTAGVESQRLRYRFSDAGDDLTGVDSSSDGGASWTTTRYVILPEMGMAAESTGSSSVFELSNLHGDVVGTMSSASGTSIVSAYTEADEYGNSATVSTRRFGWLGTSERPSDTTGSFLILMGRRLYNPSTGTFESPDPVAGGNDTNYGYPSDPINLADPSGCRACVKGHDWANLYKEKEWWGPWHRGSGGFLKYYNFYNKIADLFDWSPGWEWSIDAIRHRWDHNVQIFHTCEHGIRYGVKHAVLYYEGQGLIRVYYHIPLIGDKTVFRHWITDPVTLGDVGSSTTKKWRL